MKLMSFTVPVLIVSLTVIAIWAVGMLAVRASAVSTQTSIDLLRMHLRVERLHEELLRHSRNAVAAQMEALPGMSRPWPEAAPQVKP
jgi:hypothetical protein